MKEIKMFEPFFKEWTVCARLERTGYVGAYIIKNSETSKTAILNHISIPRSEENLNVIRKMVSNEDEVSAYFEKNKKLVADEIEYAISLNECEYIYKTYEYEVRKKEDHIGWDIFVRLEDLKKAGELREESDIIKMGIDICCALEFCEEKNVAHCNITPDAIYRSQDGTFKLGNFKLYDADAAININYASPELAEGLETDIQTDIYSLGIVLFQLLNDGTLPFVQKGEKNEIVIRRASMDRLKGRRLQLPESVSPTLAKAVLCACNVNREQRYKSPSDFKRNLISALKRAVPNEEVSAEKIKSEEDKKLSDLEKKINDDLKALGLSSIIEEIADEIKEAENAMQTVISEKKAKISEAGRKSLEEDNHNNEEKPDKEDLRVFSEHPDETGDKINSGASEENKGTSYESKEQDGAPVDKKGFVGSLKKSIFKK